MTTVFLATSANPLLNIGNPSSSTSHPMYSTHFDMHNIGLYNLMFTTKSPSTPLVGSCLILHNPTNRQICPLHLHHQPSPSIFPLTSYRWYHHYKPGCVHNNPKYVIPDTTTCNPRVEAHTTMQALKEPQWLHVVTNEYLLHPRRWNQRQFSTSSKSLAIVLRS